MPSDLLTERGDEAEEPEEKSNGTNSSDNVGEYRQEFFRLGNPERW